jgi:hypothetical protein
MTTIYRRSAFLLLSPSVDHLDDEDMLLAVLLTAGFLGLLVAAGRLTDELLGDHGLTNDHGSRNNGAAAGAEIDLGQSGETMSGSSSSVARPRTARHPARRVAALLAAVHVS